MPDRPERKKSPGYLTSPRSGDKITQIPAPQGACNEVTPLSEHNQEKTAVFSSLRTWFHAIYSHIGFLVVLGLILSLSLLPAIGALFAFFYSGSVWCLALFFPAMGLVGILWTAVNRTAWDLQFSYPMYRFKALGKYLKENASQGFLLGVLFSLLWALVLSPYLLLMAGALELTHAVLACTVCLGMVLSIVGSYSFYQAGRWQLSLGQILKNSFLLMFSVGLPSLVTGAAWIILLALTVLQPHYMLPLYLFLSLPALVCITTQSFYVPKIDAIMAEAAE